LGIVGGPPASQSRNSGSVGLPEVQALPGFGLASGQRGLAPLAIVVGAEFAAEIPARPAERYPPPPGVGDVRCRSSADCYLVVVFFWPDHDD